MYLRVNYIHAVVYFWLILKTTGSTVLGTLWSVCSEHSPHPLTSSMNQLAELRAKEEAARRQQEQDRDTRYTRASILMVIVFLSCHVPRWVSGPANGHYRLPPFPSLLVYYVASIAPSARQNCCLFHEANMCFYICFALTKALPQVTCYWQLHNKFCKLQVSRLVSTSVVIETSWFD